MEAFIESTLQNCFSIAVSAFLLLRMEGELRALRGAIDRLRYCQICRFAPLPSATVSGAPEDAPEGVAS
ncbi:MAG: YvrJ family protein [Synergistaceae bacterium]|jgi:hypothetical protein|nr:YvrJ family protein [Synergistaceae bacterium]